MIILWRRTALPLWVTTGPGGFNSSKKQYYPAFVYINETNVFACIAKCICEERSCLLIFSYKVALAELPQRPSVIYEASLMFARNIFPPRWLFLLTSFDTRVLIPAFWYLRLDTWEIYFPEVTFFFSQVLIPAGRKARQTKVPLMFSIHSVKPHLKANFYTEQRSLCILNIAQHRRILHWAAS